MRFYSSKICKPKREEKKHVNFILQNQSTELDLERFWFFFFLENHPNTMHTIIVDLTFSEPRTAFSYELCLVISTLMGS